MTTMVTPSHGRTPPPVIAVASGLRKKKEVFYLYLEKVQLIHYVQYCVFYIFLKSTLNTDDFICKALKVKKTQIKTDRSRDAEVVFLECEKG